MVKLALLASTENILEVVLKFVAKWKIYNKVCLLSLFNFFQLDYINETSGESKSVLS